MKANPTKCNFFFRLEAHKHICLGECHIKKFSKTLLGVTIDKKLTLVKMYQTYAT